VKFYEKPRPHVMYHADTMEIALGNGSLIYQISVNDTFIKRWKYWEYVSGIAVDYMLKKYLL
jgi:hypothetical protein